MSLSNNSNKGKNKNQKQNKQPARQATKPKKLNAQDRGIFVQKPFFFMGESAKLDTSNATSTSYVTADNAIGSNGEHGRSHFYPSTSTSTDKKTANSLPDNVRKNRIEAANEKAITPTNSEKAVTPTNDENDIKHSDRKNAVNVIDEQAVTASNEKHADFNTMSELFEKDNKKHDDSCAKKDKNNFCELLETKGTSSKQEKNAHSFNDILNFQPNSNASNVESIGQLLVDKSNESVNKQNESKASQAQKQKPSACSKSLEENLQILNNLSASDIKNAPPLKKTSFAADCIRYTLMTLFIIAIAVSTVNIFVDIQSKKRDAQYYSSVREMYYSGNVSVDSISYLAKEKTNVPENKLFSDEGIIAKKTESSPLLTEYMELLPNLEALKQINSDIFGWIKVKNTDIDYPVVKAPYGNNDYYLYRGTDHEINNAGAIFMDYKNITTLSENKNTCIYGHNMGDGTMFNSLKHYRYRPTLQAGEIQVSTAAGIYIYKPFSAYEAMPTESFFKTSFSNDEEYSEFLKIITLKSMYKATEEPDADDKIITLVTCTNTLIDKRFVVHGVLTDIIR